MMQEGGSVLGNDGPHSARSSWTERPGKKTEHGEETSAVVSFVPVYPCTPISARMEIGAVSCPCHRNLLCVGEEHDGGAAAVL